MPESAFPVSVNHSETQDHVFRVVATLGCGSAHEPRQWPGLAHLLEHALFLGTESTQSIFGPGEIQGKFLQMGGSINASTQLYHTSYIIECPEDYALKACEYLAQLIFCPQFMPDRVIAEVDIIESEYRARCSDSWQQIQSVLQEQIEEDNDFAHFCAGNKKSLGFDDPCLIQALSDFYHQHYALSEISLYIECSPPIAADIPFEAENIFSAFGRPARTEHSSAMIKEHGARYLIASPEEKEPHDNNALHKKALSGCSIAFPESRLFVKAANNGYEWCWVLPLALLPAFDQIGLPDRFTPSVRMVSSDTFLASIFYQACPGQDDVISEDGMQSLWLQLKESFRIDTEQPQITTPRQAPGKRAIQQSLYHHYAIAIIDKDILSPALKKYLSQPADIALIVHPHITGKQKTRYFRSSWSVPETISETRWPVITERVMPFRALMSSLASDDDQQEIICYDTENQAALIWLTPERIKDKDQALADAHFAVWALQNTAYQELRIRQRLGYVVHTGFYEVNQKPGILIIVQGERSRSGHLLSQKLQAFIRTNSRLCTSDLSDQQAQDWSHRKQALHLKTAPGFLDLSEWTQTILYSKESSEHSG